MDIPRFSRENLNPKFCKQDIGDSYQEFIHDLLMPEYPDLHLFPARGKDGAIDLSHTKATSRTVIECKYIGEDRQNDDCESEWRNVAKKLNTHLADPDGPTKGQAQYEPWYRTNPPITEYIFCVSSIRRNQGKFDTLDQEIKEFFTGLGGKFEHLSHLKELSVKIIDWSDCCSKLKQRPNLIYRWFPRTLPPGLVLLDESLDRGTFRSYLTSEKLPYYSIRQHLKTIPSTQGVDIPDEDNLLNMLKNGDTTGLIITGSGGVGKTRMMLEIGRVAKQQGWSVLRVQSRIKEDAIEQLAERITPEIPVLLLIDYIETQKGFTELVDTLNDLNERLSLKLRYVASCRKSFYPTLSAISFHKQIDLSPFTQNSARSLFEDYQRHIVYHILKNSGMEIADRYLNICNNKPILAVFVSYLHSMRRQPELAELLKEQDFGTWVSKRVQLSFGQTAINRELALIMALFPMQNEKRSHLNQNNQRALFDTLATDGWIEKIQVDVLNNVEIWVSAHDVMVDQILLSYFRSIPVTLDHFVNELLTFASKIDSLQSAILTLHRLVDQPALESLNWFKILDGKKKENIIEWRDVIDILIRTSLLSPHERISLLENQELWEGADEGIQFQNSLGWLIPWLGKHGNDAEARFVYKSWLDAGGNKELVQTNIESWLGKHSNDAEAQFIYKSWLDAGGNKELVQTHIESWLRKHGDDVEAIFVYKSLLDAGGNKELVQTYIESWLGKHGDDVEAQFIYNSLLDAGGNKELVQTHIESWLRKHGDDVEAQFIYVSWLDAGGNKELVQTHIESWIGKHGNIAEAIFIYKSWLEAGGEFSVIRSKSLLWLDQNFDKPEAVYLTKFIAKQKDIPIDTVKSVLKWCKKFHDNEDAIWRLTQLREHLVVEDIAEEFIATSEAVLAPLISSESFVKWNTRSQITILFSYLIRFRKINSGQLYDHVDTLLLIWLRNPNSYGGDLKANKISIQSTFYVERIAELIVSGALDTNADYEPIGCFLSWVNNWDPKCKLQVKSILESLKQDYPASNLWNIVKFPA